MFTTADFGLLVSYPHLHSKDILVLPEPKLLCHTMGVSSMHWTFWLSAMYRQHHCAQFPSRRVAHWRFSFIAACPSASGVWHGSWAKSRPHSSFALLNSICLLCWIIEQGHCVAERASACLGWRMDAQHLKAWNIHRNILKLWTLLFLSLHGLYRPKISLFPLCYVSYEGQIFQVHSVPCSILAKDFM